MGLLTGTSLHGRIAAERERLYRVALAWTGDEMLADDLAQETVHSGIAKSHQLRDEERLSAWLYRILNNNWKRHLRRQKSEDIIDEQLAGTEPGPCSQCEEDELVLLVRRAVASLSRKERQVISLVDLAGFRYCDVADTLDIPIGTVMSRLHRARKILAEKLRATQERPQRDPARLHIVD